MVPILFSSAWALTIVVLLVVFAAFVSWWLLLFLLPLLRRRLLDQPNSRSSHSMPVPRGGGLVFVLLTTLSSAIFWLGSLLIGQQSYLGSVGLFDVAAIPILLIPLAVVGLLDDWMNLPAGLRYLVQLVTSSMLVLTSPLPFHWLGLPFFLIAVTAVINFTNFMDGLDGLVAGCMFVAIGALSISLNAPWPLWALLGSLLGFLFWNWSPAKVFMGDVGSTFLGSVFAGLVLQATTWTEAFGYLLVATPLLADACLCVLRRLVAGQRVFQAHRLHLFQRLHQAGWSHSRVSLTYITATTLLAAAMLSGGWTWVFSLAFAELLIGVLLDQRVAVPFAVASSS